MTRVSAESSSSPSSMPPGNIGHSGRLRAGVPPSRASRRSTLVSVTSAFWTRLGLSCNSAVEPRLPAAVPAVVAEHDDQLVAGEARAVQLRVQHQVRAVADERDHLALRAGHARAPGTGELVAHGRVAVLAVERADTLREPVHVHLAGQ